MRTGGESRKANQTPTCRRRTYGIELDDLDDVTPLPPAPVATLSDIERARGESIVDGVMDGFAAGLGMTREQLEVATEGAVPAPRPRSRAKRRR
jgi:hypothetical protein